MLRSFLSQKVSVFEQNKSLKSGSCLNLKAISSLLSLYLLGVKCASNYRKEETSLPEKERLEHGNDLNPDGNSSSDQLGDFKLKTASFRIGNANVGTTELTELSNEVNSSTERLGLASNQKFELKLDIKKSIKKVENFMERCNDINDYIKLLKKLKLDSSEEVQDAIFKLNSNQEFILKEGESTIQKFKELNSKLNGSQVVLDEIKKEYSTLDNMVTTLCEKSKINETFFENIHKFITDPYKLKKDGEIANK